MKFNLVSTNTGLNLAHGVSGVLAHLGCGTEIFGINDFLNLKSNGKGIREIRPFILFSYAEQDLGSIGRIQGMDYSLCKGFVFERDSDHDFCPTELFSIKFDFSDYMFWRIFFRHIGMNVPLKRCMMISQASEMKPSAYFRRNMEHEVFSGNAKLDKSYTEGEESREMSMMELLELRRILSSSEDFGSVRHELPSSAKSSRKKRGVEDNTLSKYTPFDAEKIFDSREANNFALKSDPESESANKNIFYLNTYFSRKNDKS